jgi:hypothetical protein
MRAGKRSSARPIKESDISDLHPSSIANPSNEFDFSRFEKRDRSIFDRFVDLFCFSRALFGQMQGLELDFGPNPLRI